MTSVQLPQHEGRFSPEEAQAWTDAQIQTTNHAGDKDMSARALGFAKGIVEEWQERVRPLHRRWKLTWWMLQGNSPERGGPEDVHVPEIYKAIETIVPRVEEALIERDPFFRIVPRRSVDKQSAIALSAYMDWTFDQANVRDLMQPAIRDMLVSQCAAFHVTWDNVVKKKSIRTVEKTFIQGRMKKTVKVKRENVVVFSGPKAKLIDPLDFIIDTKATCPQTAVYVGHRAWLSMDEILRIGKQQGWQNLDKIRGRPGGSSTMTAMNEQYRWTRDPTARWGTQESVPKNDGRPEKLEVVILYSKFSLSEGADYADYRMVMVDGSVVVELRENPYDAEMRPYATARSSNNGHEFYGTGHFDNAIRLNQHLDLYHQIFLRTAHIAGQPMVFTEEDSDMPDTLYKVRPFQVFKGTGPVRFTQIPDGVLRAMPLVISTLQRNIEEVVGAFRIQMGQDNPSGTATEATLSLQEGNRRMRGIIRAMGSGLEQLLNLFYAHVLQFSSEDVEFPVLGKRALDLRKSHATVGPADLLDDVRFDLIGLHNLRTNGLKATGLQALVNGATPFMVGNPDVDTNAILHDLTEELVGREEADRYVKVRTPLDQLKSQAEENEILISGTEVEVDPYDDDISHLREMQDLLGRAMDPDEKMELDVRRVILEHYENHRFQAKRKQAQQRELEQRQPQQALAPEVGGQASPETGKASPMAGGMSDAMTALADQPSGQTQGENPGPADSRKYGKPGRSKRTTNQTENALR